MELGFSLSNSGRHLAAIEEFAQAGFGQVYVHQVGPDQEGFFRFYEREILPRMRTADAGAAGPG